MILCWNNRSVVVIRLTVSNFTKCCLFPVNIEQELNHRADIVGVLLVSCGRRTEGSVSLWDTRICVLFTWSAASQLFKTTSFILTVLLLSFYMVYIWFSGSSSLFRLLINLRDFSSCMFCPAPACSGLVSHPLLHTALNISPTLWDIVVVPRVQTCSWSYSLQECRSPGAA